MTRPSPEGAGEATPLDGRVLGVAALLLAACWCAVVLYVLHAVLPFNPVALPAERTARARLWGPQGWKFFTRNPREDWMIPYHRDGDGVWRLATRGPNARLDALWGIDRRPRAQGIELGLLLRGQPREAWEKCQDEPAACLERSLIKDTVHNRTANPTLCGVIGVVFQQQLPWAWAPSADSVRMPSRVAKFRVRC